MKVSRSGYYKWLKDKDKLNQYEINRKDLGNLIKDIHNRKPSYGYHRINAVIRREIGWIVSDNLVHKVCKILNIKSLERNQLSIQIRYVEIGIQLDLLKK